MSSHPDDRCPTCGAHQARGNTWTDEIDDDGEFVRAPTEFRDFVTDDPDAKFPAVPGRYHLYVSYACPWAHRTLIARALKGLEDVVAFSVVHPLLDGRGWHFEARAHGVPTVDHLYGSLLLRELYDRSVPSDRYRGRITVPVLWDGERETIVNNESAEILRMFNRAFDAHAGRPDLDLYPDDLAPEIDALNEWIYPCINNGVYRCGFATKQTAYERAFHELFGALDRAEAILGESRYLTGDRLTEADIRLFTTLVRFDPVYHNHFRCNLRKLREYPNLWGFLLDVAQIPGVSETIDLDHIKSHYYRSHTTINPSRIVPVGPAYDLTAPHGRG